MLIDFGIARAMDGSATSAPTAVTLTDITRDLISSLN
ncbi:hypothetical protein ABH931_000037 [Streptacidiphilus sp. MAP12-33]